MASKITLYKTFATPGLLTYATEMDTNATATETAINQMIDEMRGSNTSNSIIAQDILLPGGESEGRMGPADCRMTPIAGGETQVVISGGPIFIAGQRVVVTGATLTGFSSAATRYIAVSLDGLLSVETTANQQAFDIWTIVQAGATLAASGEITDNLAGQRLNGGDQANRLAYGTDPYGTNDGLLNPSFRMMDIAGDPEDAGFAASGVANQFLWVSERDGGAGSGDAVTAAEYRTLGQLALMEQARCMATATAEAVGTSASLTALNFDAAVRREPLSYFANPWFTGSGSTFTQPGATTTERANFIGTYAFAGYVEFPDSGSTGPFLVDVVAEGVTVFNARVDKVASGVTTVPIAGFFELSDDDANTIQVRTAHTGAGALNCDARFGFHMVGGA